jgi:hypothetical protein
MELFCDEGNQISGSINAIFDLDEWSLNTEVLLHKYFHWIVLKEFSKRNIFVKINVCPK